MMIKKNNVQISMLSTEVPHFHRVKCQGRRPHVHHADVRRCGVSQSFEQLFGRTWRRTSPDQMNLKAQQLDRGSILDIRMRLRVHDTDQYSTVEDMAKLPKQHTNTVPSRMSGETVILVKVTDGGGGIKINTTHLLMTEVIPTKGLRAVLTKTHEPEGKEVT